MAGITKEQEEKFISSFLVCKNGLKAMQAAGIPFDLKLMHKLMSSKKINKQIEEHLEMVDFMLGRDKMGHLAIMQGLFEQAAGLEDTKIYKITNNGLIEKTGKFVDFKAAVQLSQRIETLAGWDKQGGTNNIEVSLELGEKTEDKQEQRDDKTKKFLQVEGVV
jgi:hypothetical protein